MLFKLNPYLYIFIFYVYAIKSTDKRINLFF